MNPQELYELEPLVWKSIDSFTDLMLVPGGWIIRSQYETDQTYGISQVFVPFNNDLQNLPEVCGHSTKSSGGFIINMGDRLVEVDVHPDDTTEIIIEKVRNAILEASDA